MNINQALETAATIGKIGAAAKQSFIERDEAIDAMTLAIICGQHALLLGKPGTGKSAQVNFFAKSMGQSYFKTTMNPDLMRDDLLGPIDIAEFEKGNYTRKWTGLATSTFAFIDETGQGNGQTLNMLVGAMEEREVEAGGNVKKIPLSSMFGASNELFASDSLKVWDRFLFRIIVNPVSNANFTRMLRAKVGDVPNYPLLQAELENCIAVAREMAFTYPVELDPLLTDMHLKWSNVSESFVSDRRWQRIMLAAAAQALLEGQSEIGERHLRAARFALWSDRDEIERVNTWLFGLTDKEERIKQELGSKLSDLQKDYAMAMQMSSREQKNKLSEIGMRSDKLIKDLVGRKGKFFVDMRSTVEKLKEDVLLLY